MDKRYNNSTIISIIAHAILLWIAFTLHSAHILIPSRSDGIEVSLISETEVTPPIPALKVEKSISEVRTLSNPAEVNLKNEEKKPTEAKELPVQHTKPVPTKNSTKPVNKKENKKVAKNGINDLLNDISNDNTGGHTKNKAKGGSARGVANTNNLVSNYADKVIDQVRPYVIIPNNTPSTATAVVKVTLLPNMKVYSVSLVRSSGNSDYDANVQQAIKNVSVFPPLPDNANWSDYRTLVLTFRPE